MFNFLELIMLKCNNLVMFSLETPPPWNAIGKLTSINCSPVRHFLSCFGAGSWCIAVDFNSVKRSDTHLFTCNLIGKGSIVVWMWQCKGCSVAVSSRLALLNHYKVKHPYFGRTSQYPCCWWSLHPKSHWGNHSGNLRSQISGQIWGHWDCPRRPESPTRLG